MKLWCLFQAHRKQARAGRVCGCFKFSAEEIVQKQYVNSIPYGFTRNKTKRT